MVKHKNDSGTYKHLDYKHRPHSEYRTVVHVTVQLLQPKLDVPDHAGWQHVADIFNHIFADDLDAQNVRKHKHVYWRDQYVHHDAAGRPREWKEVLRPDEELTAEERQRRAGYRVRIRQAARDLGIALPNSASTAAASSGTTTSGPKSKRKRRNHAAEVDDEELVKEDENAQPQFEETGYERMRKRGRKQVPYGKQDRKKINRTAEAAKLDSIPSKEEATGQPKPKRNRSTGVAEEAVEEDDEEWDGKKWVKKNKRWYYEKDKEAPKWKLPGSSADLDAMRSSARSRFYTNITRDQTAESLAANEAYARSLQEDENRSGQAGRGGESNTSESLQGSDDEGSSPLAPFRGKLQLTAPSERRSRPAWATGQGANLQEMKEEAEVMSPAGETASQHPIPKAYIEKTKGLPATTQTVWRKSGKLTRKPIAGPSNAAAKPESTVSASNANTTTDGRPKSLEVPSAISSLPEESKSLARKSIGLARGTAPPLTMVHARGSETRWIEGVPHARKTAKCKNAPLTPAIVLPTSPMAKRCGMVVRAVLDGKEEDVMLCVRGECGWCNPESKNNTLGSTSRKAFGRPLVHSCCVQYDAEYDVYEFVPVDGIGEEWERELPNDVVEMKVQFNDYMTRVAYVCVKEECSVCRAMEE